MDVKAQIEKGGGEFVRDLLDLSTVLGEVHFPSGELPVGDGECGFIVIPEHYAAVSVEKFFDRPRQTAASVTCMTVDSFVTYVDAWKGSPQGRPLAFADEERGRIACVLDYDTAKEPSRRQHHCALVLEVTKEWAAWTAKSGVEMGQAAFAKFLEDNLLDVVQPDGGTLLEVATSLEVRRGVQFLSAVRLQDGQRQFTYQEAGEAAAKGDIRIPETIVLGIAPWKGCEPYRIDARLRYRISPEKGLTLWFDLVRPHRVIADAFGQIRKAVAERTGIAVLDGRVG